VIYKSDDDKQHYFEHGKYSNTPLKHVPTEHLDVVIANHYMSSNLEILKGVLLCIDYKIQRIQDALDRLNPPPPKPETETAKPALRRR